MSAIAETWPLMAEAAAAAGMVGFAIGFLRAKAVWKGRADFLIRLAADRYRHGFRDGLTRQAEIRDET